MLQRCLNLCMLLTLLPFALLCATLILFAAIAITCINVIEGCLEHDNNKSD